MSFKQRISLEISKYLNIVQILRVTSLSIFSFISILIGVEFYFFIESINSDRFYPRPPGVDAYLPISSLMNIKYFFGYGDIHMAHPAGFFIILSAITVSFIFPKSFCSWVCPFGFLSEVLIFLRRILIFKDFKINRYLDYFFRSFKYLILGFFIYIIFFKMTFFDIKAFLDSDYNKIADIKMFYFFADISKTALSVIIIIFLLSFLFNFFWCRYLCPYGAFMAIIGLISPVKIKRNLNSCISCVKCADVCPHYIEVDRKRSVFSDDCSFCALCIGRCHKEDTLGIKLGNIKIKPIFVFFIILSVFLSYKYLAINLKKWENNLTQQDYKELIKIKDFLNHPS